MIPKHSKHFLNKVVIQEAIEVSDNFGGFNTTYANAKEVFGYIYNKSKSVLDSAGQSIWSEEKRCAIRLINIKIGDRLIYDNKIYTIDDIKETYKGTQIDLGLEFVGFVKFSLIVDRYIARVINDNGQLKLNKNQIIQRLLKI